MAHLSFFSKTLNTEFIRLWLVGLCSFLWMIGTTAAQQYDLPPLAKVGNGGVVAAEEIFDIANKPTKECMPRPSQRLQRAWSQRGSRGRVSGTRMSASGSHGRLVVSGRSRLRS